MRTPTRQKVHALGIGTHYVYDFANGYSASVIQTPFSYGGNEGLWELAVKHGKYIVYDTPITDDVIGHLTEEQVDALLCAIEVLPPRESGT